MTNQNIRGIFVVAIAVALVFPFAHAEAITPILKNINLKFNPVLPAPKAKNTEAFCTKFTDTANTLASNISKQQTKAVGFLTEREGAIKDGRDARDADLQESRDKAEQKRNDWYKRLEDKADTDAKKNAVVLFKQTVNTAVDTRQKAVDGAVEAFRKGVDDAVSVRNGSMQSTNNDFQTAVNAAVAKVKTDCDNGETTAMIRSNFKTSLKNARDTLKADKKNMDKVGAQVKALAATRQDVVKKAVATFQTTLKTAIADLKKAFGE